MPYSSPFGPSVPGEDAGNADKRHLGSAPGEIPEFFIQKCKARGIYEAEEVYFAWRAYYARQMRDVEERLDGSGRIPLAPGKNSDIPGYGLNLKDHPLTIEEKRAAGVLSGGIDRMIREAPVIPDVPRTPSRLPSPIDPLRCPICNLVLREFRKSEEEDAVVLKKHLLLHG